jgi:hypothetical protein
LDATTIHVIPGATLATVFSLAIGMTSTYNDRLTFCPATVISGEGRVDTPRTSATTRTRDIGA